MIVYVDNENQIKDVVTTKDSSLIPLEITDGTFDGWSVAKICCYKVTVDSNGHVTMNTPYVDSRLIEHIDQLGKQTEAITPKQYTKTAYIDDTECVVTDVPTGNMTVYCSVPHTVERDGDRVTVKFEPLEEVIEVTISII
jgi:hypothetical protein